MKRPIWKLLQAVTTILALFLLGACGSSSSTSSSTETGIGQLSVSLTDATLYQYQGVYVTIDEVSVHVGATETGGTTVTTAAEIDDDEGEWKTILIEPQTVNLLELVNGVLLGLGITDLEAGHYTQLRLQIGKEAYGENADGEEHPYANYVITEDGMEHELKVPSNKIKLVRGFDIYAGETTELILDFDAAKSVVKAGNDKKDKWILKPTIKVLGVYAMIHGTVADADGPLQEALVSAQFITDAVDVADQVVNAAATVTEEDGTFALMTEPGAYNLVAFAEGYEPACMVGETSPGMAWTADFLLIESTTGVTLTGEVNVSEGDIDQAVSISVRQQLHCPDESVLVEIVSDQVANGGTYSFVLPAGTYDVVASTTDETTIVRPAVTLDEGQVTTEDFTFE